ncbi:MAG: hypothetical protein RJQ07_06835 [Pseudomonadales bacterium]
MPTKSIASTLIAEAAQIDPKQAADLLVSTNQEQAWLDAFAEQLDRQRNAEALRRILSIWDLSQSDAARIFGVSRQAISKWFDTGVPADRAVSIADLGAATDLLVRHLKRDRVPGVVRRPASRLGNRSLVDLLMQQGFAEVLEACRAMFAFSEANH